MQTWHDKIAVLLSSVSVRWEGALSLTKKNDTIFFKDKYWEDGDVFKCTVSIFTHCGNEEHITQ